VSVLRKLVASYRALLVARWSEMLQYRASVFIWTLWSLAGPVIHLSVWRSIQEANGDIAGYGRDDIVAYFLAQSIVYHFIAAWQAYEFGYLIRTGTLSARLLKPFDPSHHFVASNVAFKAVNLIWLIPIWTGMFLYFRPEMSLSPSRALLFALAVGLAGTLEFLWSQVFAMLSFWTVRSDSLFDLSEALSFLVGGGIAPVAFLPAALAQVSAYLPFYYILGFPIEVITGVVPAEAVWRGLAASLGWSALLFALYRILWRAGLKRYGAVGA